MFINNSKITDRLYRAWIPELFNIPDTVLPPSIIKQDKNERFLMNCNMYKMEDGTLKVEVPLAGYSKEDVRVELVVSERMFIVYKEKTTGTLAKFYIPPTHSIEKMDVSMQNGLLIFVFRAEDGSGKQEDIRKIEIS
jgi:HSP20 family molecular chaperone IbpA